MSIAELSEEIETYGSDGKRSARPHARTIFTMEARFTGR